MTSSRKPDKVRPVEASSALGYSIYNSPFSRPLDSTSPSSSRVASAQAQLQEQPNGTDPYATARTFVLETALEQGYDAATMVERGVVWGEDQDPFGHVTNTAFPRFFSACNWRVTEGFARFLGDQDGARMRRGEGICPLVRGYEFDIRKPVQYPDSLIIANRLTTVKPDRYHGVTTIWSLRQQKVVAECQGWIVWYDFDTGKAVDLLQKGGVWTDLYHGLLNMAEAASNMTKTIRHTNPGLEKGNVEKSKKANL